MHIKSSAILTGFMGLLLAQAVSAMPCDKSYQCRSKSGKYEVNAGACILWNRLSLNTVKINHVVIEKAVLGPAYDGGYEGGPLNFEIELPLTQGEQQAGARRILTIEVPAKTNKGEVSEKLAASEP